MIRMEAGKRKGGPWCDPLFPSPASKWLRVQSGGESGRWGTRGLQSDLGTLHSHTHPAMWAYTSHIRAFAQIVPSGRAALRAGSPHTGSPNCMLRNSHGFSNSEMISPKQSVSSCSLDKENPVPVYTLDAP